MSEEWRALANVIDRLLFVISFVVLVFFAVWMTINGLRNPHLQDAVLVSFWHQRDES